MTTLDTASGTNAVPSDGAKTKVIKVFLLDGKTVQENRDWMSVVRFTESGDLRLFLHDAKGYRAISQTIALSLLSKLERRSLLAILKRKTSNSGGGLAVRENCIRRESSEHGEDDLHVNEADREGEQSSGYSTTECGNHLKSDEIFSAGRPTGISMPLFRDHGNTLATNSNSAGVAESLVRIAHARGWTAIRVYGSDAFRHAVWLEAVKRGMRVRGYLPLAAEKPSPSKEAESSARHVLANYQGVLEQENMKTPRPTSDTLKKSVHEQQKHTLSVSRKETPLHPRMYRARVDAIQFDADTMTIYTQAVVMARIYENLSQEIVRSDLPLMQIDGFPDLVPPVYREPSLEQI